MVNSKKKGNLWENRLTNWLRDKGIKAWRDNQSGGGNREKGDVGNNLDMTIESKAAKSIKLMEWWKQVSSAADKHGNSPVLFIHQDGMREDNWLVVMHSEDWAALVVKEAEEPDYSLSSEDREKRWALENLKSAITKALKHL